MLAAANPFPQQFFDSSGGPLNAGSIYIGAAGQNPVTNPIPIYWDAAGLIPAPQPVRTLNGAPSRNGSPAVFFVPVDSFSMLARDKTGRQVFYSAFAGPANASLFQVEPTQTAADGQTVFSFNRVVYTLGNNSLWVFVDGFRVTDFSETANNKITFSAPLRAGMKVDVIAGAPINSSVVSDSSNIVYSPADIGAATRSMQGKLRESMSFLDLGAVGNGVTVDDAAVAAAAAFAAPIYVPWTASFYKLSTLPASVLARMWGPGSVQVGGVVVPISTSAAPTAASSASSSVNEPALAPPSNTPAGSVGYGSLLHRVVRSGGFGQYGNALFDYLNTAATPAPQFDVGVTTWATSTNMTGGSHFGLWAGANSPASALSETFSSGAVIGAEINAGNRWQDFGLQTDLGGTRYSVGLQIVPDVIPTSDVASTVVTISGASPAVVGWTAHGLTANTPVVFSGSGLPTPVMAGTTYYVLASGLSANSFQISASIGGAAIGTTAASTGTSTAIASFPGSFGFVIAASVHAHKWWVGNLIRYDALMPGGVGHMANGGSAPGINLPQAWAALGGYWVNGIDFSSASFSGVPLAFNSGQVSGTATAGGGGVLPSTVAGYVKITVDGVTRKVPYFAN